MTPSPRRCQPLALAPVGVLLAGSLLACSLGACSWKSTSAPGGLISNDLGHSAPIVAGTGQSTVPDEILVTQESTRTMTPEQATEGLDDVIAIQGNPASSMLPSRENALGASDVDGYAGKPQLVGSLLVDAMVGQVNGRPIYAGEFFAPMDTKLRRDAEQLEPRKWLEETRAQIKLRLRSRVIDELLLAEFEAAIPDEQRPGLLAWVSSLRDQIISENRGSETIARQKVSAEEGLTIEEQVEKLRDRELIQQQLRAQVTNRIFISRREVEQEYERRSERFNPLPDAVFRLMLVPTSEADRVQRVQTALDSGESFEAVARRESTYSPEEGGLHKVKLDAPTVAQSTIFGVPELNDPAQQLAEGQTVGPFPFRSNTAWITLESLESKSVALYDAQLELYNILWNARFAEETDKYLRGLYERGSLDDVEQMERRLLEIAADRYLVSGVQDAQH